MIHRVYTMDLDLSAIQADVSSRAVKTPTGDRSFTSTYEDPIDPALGDLVSGLQSFLFAANVENVNELRSERICSRLNKSEMSRFLHDLAHYVGRGVKALDQAGKDKRKHRSHRSRMTRLSFKIS